MTDRGHDAAQAAAPDRSYPCRSCGATLVFAPGSNALRCPYCGHEQAIAQVPREVREHAFGELARLPAKPLAAPDGVKVFRCPGCHAVTESDTLSVRCQFCATPLVADATATERVVPEAVVPYGLSREEAREALRKWTSSRWFAPSSLKKVTEAETFRGTYLPHWTYDADTVSDYVGQRGEHYWVTETYTATEDGRSVTRTRQVQKTRWYPTRGTVQRAFDDVLVSATSQVADERLDDLAPWPLEQALPYQEQYLAGFRTLRYDIEPEPGLETAKAKMAEVITADCEQDIGGDEQRVDSVDTRYFDITFKLVLLPVWFLSYLHAGTSWPVMVNARTGEVIGERPYSGVKIAAASVLALLVVVLVVWLTRSHS